MNRVTTAAMAPSTPIEQNASLSTSAAINGVQVPIARPVEPSIRLVLEAEIFQDPDGGPDSLIVTTDTLACEPTAPARLRVMVEEARAQLDQIERLARVYEAQDTLRGILAEHNLPIEEWDPATLSPWLRDHLTSFCMYGGDTPLVIVPKGQDPIERVNSVAKLINSLTRQS
jgi:hypothetical protein